MSDLINLSVERAKRYGVAFMDCPTCNPAHDEEGTDWAAVCRFNGNRPFVAAMVCLRCGSEVVLDRGEPVEVRRHD